MMISTIDEIGALRKIKEAHQFVKDITSILKITTATIGVLKRYAHYRPVMDILTQIKQSNHILEIHKKRYEAIIKGT